LLTSREDIPPLANQCPVLLPLAAFQVSLIGRFSVSPEALCGLVLRFLQGWLERDRVGGTDGNPDTAADPA
jgi:hypothetical protein